MHLAPDAIGACKALSRPSWPVLNVQAHAVQQEIYRRPSVRLANGWRLDWQATGAFHVAGELCGHCAGQALRISIDRLGELEASLLGVEAFMPSDACTALAEQALAPVLDHLEQMFGHVVLDLDFRRAVTGTESDPVVGFVLSDAAGSRQLRGRVVAAPSLWHMAAPADHECAPITQLGTLPLRLALLLGRCTITVGQLRHLQPGDGLRFSPRAVLRDARSGLALQVLHERGRIGFRARTAGMDLIVDTSMSRYMDTQPSARTPQTPSSTTPSGATDLSTLVDDIETELSFDLGTLTMTLAELARLRPGQSLPLGRRIRDQRVRITTAGRQVASGELAVLGDELVVVVTDLAAQPDR